MSMNRIVLFFLMMIFALGVANAKKRTAVFVNGTVTDNYIGIINSTAIKVLTSDTELSVIERSNALMDLIKKERNYQAGGEVRIDQIVNGGRQLGVKYVLAIFASDIDDELYLSARVVNVETASVITSNDINKEISSINQLKKLTTTLCQDMLDEWLSGTEEQFKDEFANEEFPISYFYSSDPFKWQLYSDEELKKIYSKYKKFMRFPILLYSEHNWDSFPYGFVTYRYMNEKGDLIEYKAKYNVNDLLWESGSNPGWFYYLIPSDKTFEQAYPKLPHVS